MTNATKAVWIGLVNAVIQFTEAFGLYDLSEPQETAFVGLVNALMLVYVLATYTLSPKRVPDA